MKVINGDPHTLDNRNDRIQLDWFDRVFYDQLTPYVYWAETNEGINRQRGWTEYMEDIAVGNSQLQLRWWIYRGKHVKNGCPAPMIVLLEEYYRTAWQHIADDEGLILLAFEYHRNLRLPESGEGTPGFGAKPDEIETYHAIVHRIMNQLPVDPERVYLTGIAYGEISALMYAKEYGRELAGMALISGACSPYNISENDFASIPPIPVIHIRGDADTACDGYPDGVNFDSKGNTAWMQYVRSCNHLHNRDLWLSINDCKFAEPEIMTRGARTFLTYRGKAADMIFCEVAGGCLVPAIDTASIIWQMLFSRYVRRNNGSLDKIREKERQNNADLVSIALSMGSDQVYRNGTLMNLGRTCLLLSDRGVLTEDQQVYGGNACQGEALYAPVELLTRVFGIHYKIEKYDDCSTWFNCEGCDRIRLSDFRLSFSHKGYIHEMYSNTCLVKTGDAYQDLKRPLLMIDDSVMIPVAETMQLLGYETGFWNGSVYISDHPVRLGWTISRVIREELLVKEKRMTAHSVEVLNKEMRMKVNRQQIPDGGQLKITINDEVREIQVYMNGLEVPVWKTDENCYVVYNVFGDLIVDAVLNEMIE